MKNRDYFVLVVGVVVGLFIAMFLGRPNFIDILSFIGGVLIIVGAGLIIKHRRQGKTKIYASRWWRR